MFSCNTVIVFDEITLDDIPGNITDDNLVTTLPGPQNSIFKGTIPQIVGVYRKQNCVYRMIKSGFVRVV